MEGLNEYQALAAYVAVYPGQGELTGVLYTALGLGEAGEVQGKVKKILRDADGEISDEVKKAIASEIGDVLWYVAMLSRELGYDLSEIADMNIDKLLDRKSRGVLGGSGDNR